MLKLSGLFSEGAVLQRDRSIPVWGWSAPHAIVDGRLGGVPARTRAGSDGRFLLRFPPRSAGGPHVLTVSADGETVEVTDLLVGEVWVAGGQSNMEFRLRDIPEKLEHARKMASSLRQVRMITIPHGLSLTPAADVQASWQVATSDGVDDWSAVGFYFAERMHRELGVPVGIISSNWGGTIAEAWCDRESLARNPDFSGRLAAYEAKLYRPEYWDSLSEEELRPVIDDYGRIAQIRMERLLPPEPANTGFDAGWADPGFDDSGWKSCRLPAQWKQLDLLFHGTVWFRKTVELPAEWAGSDLLLSIGAADKHDITYFNGVEVGRTGSRFDISCWNVPRTYRVPAALVRPGRNVIAVRNYTFLHDGGLIGPEEAMRIVPAEGAAESMPLAGDWKFGVETQLEESAENPSFSLIDNSFGVGCPNSPHILFDSMIAPLIPYAIRGVIWYQGESNAGEAERYGRLMRDLIECWRRRWGQGDFPFLQVLLAGYRKEADFEEESTWPLIREAQQSVAEATGNRTASALDLGEAADIHPHRKAEVGERLAVAALVQLGWRSGDGSGPRFREMTLEAGSVLLHFDRAASGLAVHGPKLQGFRIAGADRVFVPAEAEIVGNAVRVRAARVPNPAAVRYAWSDHPACANLYNGEGFPADPFRTDAF